MAINQRYAWLGSGLELGLQVPSQPQLIPSVKHTVMWYLQNDLCQDLSQWIRYAAVLFRLKEVFSYPSQTGRVHAKGGLGTRLVYELHAPVAGSIRTHDVVPQLHVG